jgi:hypothetical protein
MTAAEKLAEIQERGPDDILIAYRVGEVWRTAWTDMDAGGLCLGLRLLTVEVDQALLHQLPSEPEEIEVDG